MKKLFQKSLLVAAGLLVGASAWAEDQVYTCTSSESAYTDQANPTTVFNGTSVGNLQIYYTQFRDWGSSDGTVKVNTGGKIAFYKFDLSTIKSKLVDEGGVITGVTFSFTGKTADGKDCAKIRALGYNAEWSASSITNNTVSNNAGTITGTVTSTGSFQPLDTKTELTVNSEKTLDVNAMTYVKSAIDENKDYVSFAITANYTRAGLLNTTASLKVTYSTAARADYTINYQLDGTTVASESNSADVGATVNAQTSIWNEGKTQKYFVTEDATTSFIVANGTNEFIVPVREAEIWTYYVKAFAGSEELMTISTNTVVEGETASYGYPQYIAVDGVLYKATAQSSNPWWGESYTITENNSVRGFQYAKEGNESIVFCSEAENIEGLEVVSGGNTDIRASNRKGAYATAETTITTLEPGIYRVFGACYGNAGTTFNLKAGDATVFTVATSGNPAHTTGGYFLITETTDLVMPAAGNAGTSPKVLDYIIVQKAGEYYETMSIVGDFSEGGFDDLTKGISMTRDADNPFVWTAVVENFSITSDKYSYDYKAVANQDYNVYQLPAGMDNQNYGFDYDGAREGTYTLTFTVNTQAHSVELSPLKLDDNTYTVAGNNEEMFGTAWDSANTNNDMTRNSDNTFTWKKEGVELAANTTIQYKVTKNHGWGESWPNDNKVIEIKDAGKYDITITFASATKEITEAIAIQKTISSAGYATYYSSYDLNFEGTGVTAYVAAVNGSEVSFEEVTEAKANTGLLLKAAEGTYSLPMLEASDAAKSSALVGVLVDTEVAAGSFVLLNGAKGVGFYKTSQPFTVGANTAYLPAAAGEARTFIGFNGESTTAIEGVAAAQENVVVYNLKGQRVAQPTKGLYIVNGKKVVLK